MNFNRILIIDDDIVITKSISLRLEKRGFVTKTANSGIDTIKNFDLQNVDLIVLDIKMPKLSGLEVLSEIRKKFSKNILPIIMFSSNDGDEDIIEALKLGANDYVSKPVNFDVLLSRVNSHLDLKRLSLEHSKKEQVGVVAAMIATYNHEINNALAIGMGHLDTAHRKEKIAETEFQDLFNSFVRIQKVVKKISDLADENEILLTDYTEDVKMVKLD